MSSGRRITTDPSDRLMIRGRAFTPEDVIEILKPYLSDDRARRLRNVVEARTRSVVTVVEGISNYGNLSAVMRTAEGLGFFEVHIVTRDQPYKQSRRTTQGAEKWLEINVWSRPSDCVRELRRRGYQIAVTDSGPDTGPLDKLDFLQKTAVVLGNETEGVSGEMRSEADVMCRIDMSGFVESYNISVAAALILYHAYSSRIRVRGHNGDLDPTERTMLEAQYHLRSVQRAEGIVVEHVRRMGRDI